MEQNGKQYRDKEQDRRITLMETTLNNHMNTMSGEIASIKTDVSWLKKNHWQVRGALAGGVLSFLVGLAILLFK